MKKVWNKNQLIFLSLICLFVAVLVSFYYYNCLGIIYIPIHSDDAGSTLALMDDLLYGGHSYLKNNYSIFAVFARLSTFLFGYTEFATIFVFVLQFFIMYFLLCCIILMRNGRKSGKLYGGVLLFSLYISAMQGVQGAAEIQISKFHTGPTILLMLILLLMILAKKKVNKILIPILMLMGILQDDIVLALCVCIIPILLYFFWQNKEKGCLLFWGLLSAGAFCAINNVYFQISNRKLIDFANLYGNRPFSSFDVLLQNISTYFEGLFGMFNCQIINKSIVDISFIANIIKAGIVVVGLAYAFYTVSRYFIRGIEDDNIITISSLTIVVVSAAYLFTGRQGDPISMRYCQVILFLLTIILCDLWQKTIYILSLSVSYQRGLVFILLLGITSQVVWRNTNEVTYLYDDLKNKLEDMESKTAVAPYWSSNVVSILSEGEILVQPCQVGEGKLFKSDISNISIYDDKCTEFNTIVSSNLMNDSYSDQAFNMSPEEIEKIYDNPIEKQIVNNAQVIFKYDYDVRTSPIRLDSEDILKTSDGAQQVYNYIWDKECFGTYRIEISGKNLENKLEVGCGKGSSVTQTENYPDKAVFTVTVLDAKAELPIEIRLSDSLDSDLSNVEIKVIFEALPIEFKGSERQDEKYDLAKNETLKSESIHLLKGSYKLVMYGENIDDLIPKANNDKVILTKDVVAKKRAVYEMILENDDDVVFSYNAEKESVLEKCFIESAY